MMVDLKASSKVANSVVRLALMSVASLDLTLVEQKVVRLVYQLVDMTDVQMVDLWEYS